MARPCHVSTHTISILHSKTGPHILCSSESNLLILTHLMSQWPSSRARVPHPVLCTSPRSLGCTIYPLTSRLGPRCSSYVLLQLAVSTSDTQQTKEVCISRSHFKTKINRHLSYSFYCCDKRWWLRQLMEGRATWGLQFQRNKSPWPSQWEAWQKADSHGAGVAAKWSHLSNKQKPEKAYLNVCKPTYSDIFPSPRPELLILPK